MAEQILVAAKRNGVGVDLRVPGALAAVTRWASGDGREEDLAAALEHCLAAATVTPGVVTALNAEGVALSVAMVASAALSLPEAVTAARLYLGAVLGDLLGDPGEGERAVREAFIGAR